MSPAMNRFLVFAIFLCCTAVVSSAPVSLKSWKMVDGPAVSREKRSTAALLGALNVLLERAHGSNHSAAFWDEAKNFTKKIMENDKVKHTLAASVGIANTLINSEAANKAVETIADHKNKVLDDGRVASAIDTAKDFMNHELVKSAVKFGRAYIKSSHEQSQAGGHLAADVVEFAASKLQKRSSGDEVRARVSDIGDEVKDSVGDKLKSLSKDAEEKAEDSVDSWWESLKTLWDKKK